MTIWRSLDGAKTWQPDVAVDYHSAGVGYSSLASYTNKSTGRANIAVLYGRSQSKALIFVPSAVTLARFDAGVVHNTVDTVVGRGEKSCGAWAPETIAITSPALTSTCKVLATVVLCSSFALLLIAVGLAFVGVCGAYFVAAADDREGEGEGTGRCSNRASSAGSFVCVSVASMVLVTATILGLIFVAAATVFFTDDAGRFFRGTWIGKFEFQ